MKFPKKYRWNDPHWIQVGKGNRIRNAGRKLARIDWSRFRPARWTEQDYGTMARIPDLLLVHYVGQYALLEKGRP